MTDTLLGGKNELMIKIILNTVLHELLISWEDRFYSSAFIILGFTFLIFKN